MEICSHRHAVTDNAHSNTVYTNPLRSGASTLARRLAAMIAVVAMAICGAVDAAAVERMVKSIDAIIELPKAGDNTSVEPTLTSAKTSWGDLAANGAVTLGGVSWKGTFDRDKNYKDIFKPGYTYVCTMSFVFTNDPGKTQYYANYVTTKQGWEVRNFSVTVNGKPTEFIPSAMRAPSVSFTYTVPGEIGKDLSAKAADKFHQEQVKSRKMNKCYDHALADAHLIENNPHKPYVYNVDSEFLPLIEDSVSFWGLNTIIVQGKSTGQKLTSIVEGAIYYPNVRHFWISQDSNAVDIIAAIYRAMFGRHAGGYNKTQIYASSSFGIRNATATVYVPEAQVAAVKEYLKNFILQPVYRVKAYKGDVFEAQRTNAAHDICDKHLYTAAITAADRVVNYATCDSPSHYYYSCTYCGKIEHNPNHVFIGVEPGPKVITKATLNKYGAHNFFDDIAGDDCYIGVNSAGQHVYWTSCVYCHKGWGYCCSHPSDRDLIGWKPEDAKAMRKYAVQDEKLFVKEALASDKEIANTFTMPDRNTARVSADRNLQSDVNYALCVNLVDKPLLGNDYTLAATRRQLLSIAVRLAEELTGAAVPLAAASPYADANDTIALKAATIGITADFATSRLDPDRATTRQEMATAIYRTLRYVEQHSDYSYTDYDSRLDSYSDRARIQSWAVEPMAFMDALGLIAPTGTGTIAPDAPCSIEVALSTAYKSTYAQLLGWAQLPPAEKCMHVGFLGVTPDRVTFSHTELEHSRRVWISGPRIGPNLLSAPIHDPYSGLTLLGAAEYYYHVRATGGDPDQIDNIIHRSSKSKSTSAPKSTIRRTTTKKKTVSRTTRSRR